MSAHPRWTLVATIIGSSMTFVDATVVNVALPAMQTDLHATITDVQWVIGLRPVPRRPDPGRWIVRRPVRAQASSWPAWCPSRPRRSYAAWPPPGRLIAGRALRASAPRSRFQDLAIISATFGDADRGRAIGVWSGFSSITAAIGPVLGGWLIEHVSWRAAFFLNVPLAALVVALSLSFVDESRDPSRNAPVDWTGAGLAILGLGGVVFGLLEWLRSAPAIHSFTASHRRCRVAGIVLMANPHANPMMSPDLFGREPSHWPILSCCCRARRGPVLA
jgi:MFS family permease